MVCILAAKIVLGLVSMYVGEVVTLTGKAELSWVKFNSDVMWDQPIRIWVSQIRSEALNQVALAPFIPGIKLCRSWLWLDFSIQIRGIGRNGGLASGHGRSQVTGSDVTNEQTMDKYLDTFFEFSLSDGISKHGLHLLDPKTAPFIFEVSFRLYKTQS